MTWFLPNSITIASCIDIQLPVQMLPLITHHYMHLLYFHFPQCPASPLKFCHICKIQFRFHFLHEVLFLNLFIFPPLNHSKITPLNRFSNCFLKYLFEEGCPMLFSICVIDMYHVTLTLDCRFCEHRSQTVSFSANSEVLSISLTAHFCIQSVHIQGAPTMYEILLASPNDLVLDSTQTKWISTYKVGP